MGNQQAIKIDSNHCKPSEKQNRLTIEDIVGDWYYDSLRVVVCDKGFAKIFEFRGNWVLKKTAQIKDETIAFKIDGFVLSKKKRTEIKELVWRHGENVIIWVREDPFSRGEGDPLALEHPANMNCIVPPTACNVPSPDQKVTEERPDSVLPDVLGNALDDVSDSGTADSILPDVFEYELDVVLDDISDSGTDEMLFEEKLDMIETPLLVPEYKLNAEGILVHGNLEEKLTEEITQKELNLHIPTSWVDDGFFTEI